MEFISISGYVNFEAAKFSLVKILTNKFENIGIGKGYVSITFSKITDTQMELAIFAECEIEDSNTYREILLNLSRVIDEESSIFLKEDPNESWTSTTTLKPRDSVLVVQQIHVADSSVTKVPS